MSILVSARISPGRVANASAVSVRQHARTRSRSRSRSPRSAPSGVPPPGRGRGAPVRGGSASPTAMLALRPFLPAGSSTRVPVTVPPVRARAVARAGGTRRRGRRGGTAPGGPAREDEVAHAPGRARPVEPAGPVPAGGGDLRAARGVVEFLEGPLDDVGLVLAGVDEPPGDRVADGVAQPVHIVGDGRDAERGRSEERRVGSDGG